LIRFSAQAKQGPMPDQKVIRAIGDVHGEPDLFKDALRGASEFFLLGDLVDRGPDSPGVLRTALDLIEDGRARLLRSNHDDKLYRALKGRPVKVGTNLSETLAALEAARDSADLKARFLDIFEQAPFSIAVGGYVFAHGAIHPRRFDEAGAFRPDAEFGEDHYALFGEVNGERHPNGKPVRLYGWVDALPAGVTAIVGHDQRNGRLPFLHSGARGGRAWFLDTGAGRGGPLSFIDLPGEVIGQAGPSVERTVDLAALAASQSA
jgi:hypothetical protein